MSRKQSFFKKPNSKINREGTIFTNDDDSSLGKSKNEKVTKLHFPEQSLETMTDEQLYSYFRILRKTFNYPELFYKRNEFRKLKKPRQWHLKKIYNEVLQEKVKEKLSEEDADEAERAWGSIIFGLLFVIFTIAYIIIDFQEEEFWGMAETLQYAAAFLLSGIFALISIYSKRSNLKEKLQKYVKKVFGE